MLEQTVLDFPLPEDADVVDSKKTPSRSIAGMHILSADDLTIDYERAQEVLAALYAAEKERVGLYQVIARETHAPQWAAIPSGMERGSLLHRLYLAIVTMTDRRSVSADLYDGHSKLWLECPWLYTERAVDVDANFLVPLLEVYRIGMPETNAKHWGRVMRTIFHKLHGDPLNIYAIEDACIDKIVRLTEKKVERGGWDLPGFGPKILSLLALFYAELDLMPMPPDAFPVDVHVQRFFLLTGIISSKETGDVHVRNSTLEKIIRRTICKIANENGWSRIDLSHAIWFLGNQLCGSCHDKKGIIHTCPVAAKYCMGGFATRSYFQQGVWSLNPKRRSVGLGGCNQHSFPW